MVSSNSLCHELSPVWYPCISNNNGYTNANDNGTAPPNWNNNVYANVNAPPNWNNNAPPNWVCYNN